MITVTLTGGPMYRGRPDRATFPDRLMGDELHDAIYGAFAESIAVALGASPYRLRDYDVDVIASARNPHSPFDGELTISHGRSILGTGTVTWPR